MNVIVFGHINELWSEKINLSSLWRELSAQLTEGEKQYKLCLIPSLPPTKIKDFCHLPHRGRHRADSYIAQQKTA